MALPPQNQYDLLNKSYFKKLFTLTVIFTIKHNKTLSIKLILSTIMYKIHVELNSFFQETG